MQQVVNIWSGAVRDGSENCRLVSCAAECGHMARSLRPCKRSEVSPSGGARFWRAPSDSNGSLVGDIGVDVKESAKASLRDGASSNVTR